MTASTTEDVGSGHGYVDWDFAKATGRRLVPAGPSVTPGEAADAVASLRAAAATAVDPVADTARLHAPVATGPDGVGAVVAPVLVVDRPGWIDANIDSLRGMLDPVVEALVRKRAALAGPLTRNVGGKVTGGEAGALLAFFASKVLGQYDLAPGARPRLLLVAPNVVQAERELRVDPQDFRLWVCLHEETHRVQFTAVPWLRDHMTTGARDLALDLVPDPEELPARLAQIARALPDALRSGGNGIVELFASREQRDRMARLTAVMSLLEGHADVVMDDVGPRVVPSVEVIRARFEQRRGGSGSVDRLLRRLLGLEAKMRQYRDGAAFVRGVTRTVGVDGFNAVWSSAETLPLPAEIVAPQQWVARVHG